MLEFMQTIRIKLLKYLLNKKPRELLNKLLKKLKRLLKKKPRELLNKLLKKLKKMLKKKLNVLHKYRQINFRWSYSCSKERSRI